MFRIYEIALRAPLIFLTMFSIEYAVERCYDDRDSDYDVIKLKRRSVLRISCTTQGHKGES